MQKFTHTNRCIVCWGSPVQVITQLVLVYSFLIFVQGFFSKMRENR